MRVTRMLFDQRIKVPTKRFVDSLRVYVKAGTGGNGLPKYGGIGGNGGSIWVVPDEDEQPQSLKKLQRTNPSQKWIGDVGGNSFKLAIQGKNADDISIPVPLGVTVRSETIEGKPLEDLGDINRRTDKILVAKGGPGGRPENNFFPQKGEAKFIRFDLKILADVGLVGFPNAGKSTLLSTVSKAKPRIASFAFTTLMPELGYMEYPNFRKISMADLPGLIEGASSNIGLGHRFLRHVERTRLLLFVIDVNGFQLSPKYPYRTAFETLVLLNKELELYKESLVDKPAILAVNKMDTPDAEKNYVDLIRQVENYREATDALDESIRPKHLVTFDDVIPISGLNSWNVDRVKERVLEVIDYHDELARERRLKDWKPDITSRKEQAVRLA